jgi:excisionase family DNA binding protein
MKKEFTVGEISRICNVARSTVIYWIKQGKISGYQTPGGYNRIPRENLVRFMNDYGYPLDYLGEYANTKVLIVDNDLAAVGIMKEAFDREPGFEVQATSDCFKAGLITEKLKPHVVIIDTELYGIQGQLVCKTLKEDPEFRDLKLIGISDSLPKEEQKQLLRAGFAAFFDKPLNLEELVTSVKTLAVHKKRRKRRKRSKE